MAEGKKVTRIKANDDAPKKAPKTASASKAKVVTAKKAVNKPTPVVKTGSKSIFARIGGYFKGAWVELRQVRWPNRKATWALTIAVIIFSIFFMLLITLLDTFFKWIFEIIIA